MVTLADREKSYKMANLPEEEIKKLSREQLHENYKMTIKMMLLDFFIDSNKYFSDKTDDEISLKDIEDYVDGWTSIRFKPAREDWKPHGN